MAAKQISTVSIVVSLLIISLLVLLFSIYNNADPSIIRYKIPKAKQDQASFHFSDIYTWTIPKSWEQIPNTSPMRLATFSIPLAGREAADCSVIKLSNGGGLLANINRWREQVGLKPLSNIPSADIVLQSGALGDFAYIKLSNPKRPLKAILAAIFKQKEQVLFIKLTTNKAAIEVLEADFIRFCKSIKENDRKK